MDAAPMRIAMWSGPRNISTALMRSWEARGDCAVWDEPLYAFYLERTGLPHPGAAEIIAHHEADWRRVVARLAGPVPGGLAIHYQKHMAHHLLPEIDLAWLDSVVSCFLLRDPAEMIPSLAKVIADPTIEEAGLPQQVRLFELVREHTGRVPPVIDSRDVLLDPPRLLSRLCERIGVGYTDRMLHWPPGPRPADGIWARHWYDAVHRSTGFAPYRPKNDPVPEHLNELHDRCRDLYHHLHAHRIT